MILQLSYIDMDALLNNKKEDVNMEKVDIAEFQALYTDCYNFMEEKKIIIVELGNEFRTRLQSMEFVSLLQRLAIQRGVEIKTIYEQQAFVMAFHSEKVRNAK